MQKVGKLDNVLCIVMCNALRIAMCIALCNAVRVAMCDATCNAMCIAMCSATCIVLGKALRIAIRVSGVAT